MTVLLSVLLILGVVLGATALPPSSQAVVAVLPGGAPPLQMPTPTPPAIGDTFSPPARSDTVPATPHSLWVVDICRTATGEWSISFAIAPDAIVIQDTALRDYVQFRLCLNFVPQVDLPLYGGNGFPPDWRLYVVFAANPWTDLGPAVFQLDALDLFAITPQLDPFGNFPVGSYAFALVLTDHAGVVLDVLDPLLILGGDLAASNVRQTTPSHYKCYQARGTRVNELANLADQFFTAESHVLRPVELCTPVDKNGEGLDPTSHLVCYSLKPDHRLSPPPAVVVSNQFGDSQLLELGRERKLCVPSQKLDPPGNGEVPPTTTTRPGEP